MQNKEQKKMDQMFFQEVLEFEDEKNEEKGKKKYKRLKAK